MGNLLKKTICIALTLALMLPPAVVPVSAADVEIAPMIVGVGTEQNPLIITEASQLAEVAALVNASGTNAAWAGLYYKLANDIDLSGYSNWTPIGTSTNPFKGNFDGDGFVVSNLKITPTANNQGLFGYATGATIKNLGVVNVNISGTTYSYVGGVVGYAISGSVVSNCYTTGTISGSSCVGGVVGRIEGSTVTDCYSTAKVTGNTNYAGGVVGSCASTSTVEYCYATGAISGTGSMGTGGVAGSVSSGAAASNCVALNSNITGNTNFGRVVGDSNGIFSNLYAFSGMTGSFSGNGLTHKNGANATAAVITDATIWTTAGWNSNANWTIGANKLPVLKTTDGKVIGGQDGVIPGHIGGTDYTFAGGDGESNNPYQIATAEQLAQLAALVNANNTNYNAKYYKLTADIDLSGYANWTPIGISSTNAFKGNFDGDGYVVRNLAINNSSNNQGLFGCISGATIKNLGVVNANVKAADIVGIIAGYIASSSTVQNCYATGTVAASGASNPAVGGIAGIIDGGSKVQHCYSLASVTRSTTTTGGYVGGVVGLMNSNGANAVSYCYATGAVSASGNAAYVGGVVGYNNSSSATVSNCVALNPSVTGTSNVGRVVGSNNGTLSALQGYQYTLVNGATAGIGGPTNIHGQLRNSVDFNATSIWSTFSSTNWTITANALPILKTTTGTTIGGQDSTIPAHINESGESFAGAGNVGNPYQITTAAQLAQLATFVNANNTSYNSQYYKLMNDIDLSGYANWTPIGNSTSYPFKGNFDGGGFVVKNLTINESGVDDKGLFGRVSGGTISNLGAVNVNVIGKNSVGGVAGYVIGNGSVTNCYVTGTVKGTNNVGGVVGQTNTQGTVTYCYSTAKVTGASYVGGIVYNNGGTATNCVAFNPSVTGSGSDVGRVFARTSGTLTNNYAWSDMPGTWSSKTLTGKDGADVTGAQAMTANWWIATAAWSDSVWTFRNGYLPILKGAGSDQSGDAGVYLGISDWSSFADGTGITGDGTSASDPYIITTAAQLAYIAQQVNGGNTYSGKFFKLGNDLDIGAHLWVPIGIYSADNTKAFQGTFDGNGKIISGLTINGGFIAVGLFGYTYGAIIKNLGVNVTSINNTYTAAQTYTGGLIGRTGIGSISNNCYVTGGTITASGISSEVNMAGGLLGYSGATVTNCYAAIYAVTVTAGTSKYQGGLMGNGISGITYSYWDKTLVAAGNGSGTLGTNCAGKTTAEMQADAFVTLLNTNKADAAVEWAIVQGKNNGYPTFAGESEPVSSKDIVVTDTTTGTITVDGNTQNLEEVYDSVVTDEDTAIGNVSLSLNITDNAEPSEVAAIKQIADKGSEVYFFDVTLTKTVDGSSETLTTVPVPVEIHIALTDKLAGKTGYKVYRYHGNTAEQLSSDPLRQEYYRVDVTNSEIIIYTTKFSTYAIFGNDDVLNVNGGYDIDVQAKITGEGGATYKIDIAWGAMTFEYSTKGVWDADSHSYDNSATVGWKQEGFMYGNNQITAWNHSNSDVEVSFTLTQPALTGVTMEINRSNVLGGIAAENMELTRVPSEGKAAPSIDAFFRLDGEPTNIGELDANYKKVAVITATIKAVAGSQLTPPNPNP